MSTLVRIVPDASKFNQAADLPYELRLADFEAAMRDIYDLLFDLDSALRSRGLKRLEDMMRAAGFTGLLSDALTASLARHSRALTENRHHNGHPDLIPAGCYPNDAVQSGEAGVEIKTTRGTGAVDTHGARTAWMCVFRHLVDATTEPAINRAPTRIVEVLLASLTGEDFRHNERGPLGTRTASPNRNGLAKLRANWIYREVQLT